MAAFSDRRGNDHKRLAIFFVCAFVVVCFAAVYLIGDLAKFQETMSVRESRVALRGVNDPQQPDQVLKQHPSNGILSMVALANKEAIEIDAATRRLLNEAEPRDLSIPIDLSKASRSDLDALRQDLKTAEANAAALQPRTIEPIKAGRDKLEQDARSLKLGNAVIARLMAIVDEQHRDMTSLAFKMLAARAEYYRAYERCAALLIREFGIYKVENGQFIFPFQSTANSYNSAAAALDVAAKHIAELEDERMTLSQAQLKTREDLVEAK